LSAVMEKSSTMLLRLVALDGVRPTPVVSIEALPSNDLLFAVQGDGNLKCAPNKGRIVTDGKRGGWARWVAAEMSPGAFSYQSVGHREAGRALFLSCSDGQLVASEAPMPWKLVTVEGDEEVAPPTLRSPVGALPDAPVHTLDPKQLSAFVATGVLVLPKLVADELVNDALRLINMTLAPGSKPLEGQRAWWVPDPADSTKMIPLPHVRSHPAIRALMYSSPLFGVLEQLLGSGKAKKPGMAQLALRFPNNRQDLADDQWHIDGMKTWHKSPFQLLVGVALSSQPTDDCGGLTVWPRHHGVLHEAVKRVRAMRAEPCASASAGGAEEEADDYASGDPWLGTKPALPPSESVQLKLEPGDVVIAHQKVPHRVAPNQSPHVRYQCYFRVSSMRHVPNAPLDGGLWNNFEPLQPVAAAIAAGTKACSVD